jgi:DNA-binding transcriptional MerR regulator
MKIGELAKRAGLTIHTVRYYEKVGVLPTAFRSRSGHRIYDDSILDWIEFLERMKESGMPIKEIVGYAQLWRQGAGTAAERRRLLQKQGERIEIQIGQLQSCLRVIKAKILSLTKLEKGQKK